jgi:2-iminobutanoate/2-iminopropanoate deaminase
VLLSADFHFDPLPLKRTVSAIERDRPFRDESADVPELKTAEGAIPYSNAVRVSSLRDLLFVSGQLPIDPKSGAIIQADILAQVRLALQNALAVVESLGGSTADVVKITLFLRDLSHYSEMNRVYMDVLGSARPARTVVEVSRLPADAMAEVELIAAIAASAGATTLEPS